jgi:hypothetical protein
VDSPTQISRRTVLRQAGVLAGAVAAQQAAGNLASRAARLSFFTE